MQDKLRLVMLSLDAVGKRDMEYMHTLPNFSSLVKKGAFCDNVTSVYPSLTYPAHTSIITGRKPCNHGIIANTRFQPSRENPDWLYKEKYILGDTLVSEAKKAGYKVCSLLWPVMGGAKIDYNIPEVLVTRKYMNQTTACIANGTVKYLLEINKKFGHIRKGITQPALDDFLMEACKYTINKYDPDCLLIHLTDVDTNRHKYGADTKEIKEALKRHDERIGELIKELEKTRPLSDTLFIVLGDHCQIDMHTIVYLNKLFLDKGYLTVKGGKITDYKVIAKTCDGSTYIYLNEKMYGDTAFLDELTDTLNEIRNNESLGIEEIFTGDEIKEMGADEKAFAMVEGKPGFYFLDQFEVLTEAVKDTKNHKMLAAHGCLPTKEENKTFFLASGYGVKESVKVEKMRLYDEGPTIAKIMGWSLKGADGEVVEEILK